MLTRLLLGQTKSVMAIGWGGFREAFAIPRKTGKLELWRSSIFHICDTGRFIGSFISAPQADGCRFV
jgi:hypothetical protein